MNSKLGYFWTNGRGRLCVAMAVEVYCGVLWYVEVV